MIEAWWNAHVIEFVIAGAIIGLCVLGAIIIGIIGWIKKCLNHHQ